MFVTPTRVVFVCVENSCRSQMAEAFARMDGSPHVLAWSAGSQASGVVSPAAVRTMAEVGYDLATHRSKTPAELPEGPFDVVVSMGCGDACPALPAGRREDWDVPDPKALDEAGFRAVRDEIRARVGALLASLRSEP